MRVYKQLYNLAKEHYYSFENNILNFKLYGRNLNDALLRVVILLRLASIIVFTVYNTKSSAHNGSHTLLL